MITFIGEPLRPDVFSTGAGSPNSTRIATVFPRARTIITLPTIHAMQRQAFVDQLNRNRAQSGQPALTDQEQLVVLLEAVDLIVEADKILIRPDPDRMDLAFEADSLLQELISKRRIRFLFVSEQKVRDAIAHRGEAWRIHPLPRSADQIKHLVAGARTSVGGRSIYYYNALRGSRILTCGQFASLSDLDDESLAQQMAEIADLARRWNVHCHPELELFMVQGPFSAAHFSKPVPEIQAGEIPSAVRARFEDLRAKYEAAAQPGFQQDDLEDPAWRNRMYAALIGQQGDELTESDLLGLSAEFFMQIEWLPGARIDGGELLFDSVGEEPSGDPAAAASDNTVRGLICNLMQETSDLEFVNIGRVPVSLGRGARADQPGRREVYVAHFRQVGAASDMVQIIRMQKWGVREHLDEGKDLLRAMIESEEYTDYIMDRRLGCRQLGMNLSANLWPRKLAERYAGRQKPLAGVTIRSPYFHREFINGFASDKLPSVKLKDPDYAAALATVLGRAAAPNLIVGRCDIDDRVIFDDGDEVIVEDQAGRPTAVIVADHTGTFVDFKSAPGLLRMAASYAGPVNRRAAMLADPAGFAQRYLDGFLTQFQQIQEEYRSRRRAFDNLFRHRLCDPAGNFAWRWQQVLARLEQARPEELAEAIRAGIGR